MRRTPSGRIPSPTNTSYSGISNYRTDAYKPIRDKARIPSSSQTDVSSKLTARMHFEEMGNYLADHLAKESINSRSSAREKLTKLTRTQFHELSTDVYDELLRRRYSENPGEHPAVPFLPMREEFHPKRNQAREKLASLPSTRFKDLCSDVYYELGRRHPEFREFEDNFESVSPDSSYNDQDPSSSLSKSARSVSAADNGYSNSGVGRRPSQEIGHRRRSSQEPNGHRRKQSEDAYGLRNDELASSLRRRTSEDNFIPDSPGPTQPTSLRQRKPYQDVYTDLKSEDLNRHSPDRLVHPRRPSADASQERSKDMGRKISSSVSTISDSLASATQREMIIPNKSTMTEEEIRVPYGRERESLSTATVVDEPSSRGSERVTSADADYFDNGRGSSRRSRSQTAGLSGLADRLRDKTTDEEDHSASKPLNGRISVTSDRSTASLLGSRSNPSYSSTVIDPEEVRQKYEYTIATMQSRMSSLDRSIKDTAEREREQRSIAEASVDKARVLDVELRLLKERADKQTSTMLSLQRELDDLRLERARDREREERRSQQDAEEIQQLRKLCEDIQSSSQTDPNNVEQLRVDLEGLIAELDDLSNRNDVLVAERESDLRQIVRLEGEVKEYRRKYEASKTELRGLKATSQLFLHAPKTQNLDQLPVSIEGGVLDIHITAFLSSIDNLLNCGRSTTPTSVLTPMKAVVNAVTSILDDTRTYEEKIDAGKVGLDMETLYSLRERAQATLSNLVTASKTHATSLGMSPVSLLDAAASHLSATITDIGKSLFIRRATKAEQENYLASPNEDVNGMSFEQLTNSASDRLLPESQLLAINGMSYDSAIDDFRKPGSISSSGSSSPPPIFDQPQARATSAAISDDSVAVEGSDEAWVELKPYLDAQSDSIVYAIQRVLSGVRSATPPSSLNEDLTQIITIVSSIVAVCKGSIPAVSAAQGSEIVRELSEHANRLSEVQSLPELTKESRQIMAKSSFAIANAMKTLLKL